MKSSPFLALLFVVNLVVSVDAQIIPVSRDSSIQLSANNADFSQVSEEDSTITFNNFTSSIFGGLVTQDSSFSNTQIDVLTFAGSGGQATGFSDSLSSSFSLVFDVVNQTEFRLEGVLTESDPNDDSGFGFDGGSEVILSGPATDLIFTSDPDSDVDINFDFSGTLDPGRYTFSVSSETGSVMDGVISTGPSSGNVSFVVSVPEPSATSLMFIFGALTLTRRRKTLL